MSFLRAKGLGDTGETYVINFLRKMNYEAHRAPSRTREFDLICKRPRQKQFTVEVKFDHMAQKTGNLAIEYENTTQGQASGIKGTTADIWCHLILDGDNITIWMVNTNKLREFVDNIKPFKDLVGGDGNAALKIYRQHLILPIFERLDTVSCEKEVVSIIRKLLKGT